MVPHPAFLSIEMTLIKALDALLIPALREYELVNSIVVNPLNYILELYCVQNLFGYSEHPKIRYLLGNNPHL